MGNREERRGRVSAVPGEDQKRLAREVIERGKALGSRQRAWAEVIGDYRKQNKGAPKSFAAGQAWIEKYFPDQVQRRARRGSAGAGGGRGRGGRRAAKAARAAAAAAPAPATRGGRRGARNGGGGLAESIDYRDVFERVQRKAKGNAELRQLLREAVFESLGLDRIVG